MKVVNLTAFAAVAAILCACSAVVPTPPSSPEISVVAAQKTSTDPFWSNFGGTEAQQSQSFVEQGYILAHKQCVAFFKDVKSVQEQSGFIKNLSVTAAGAGGLVAGLANVSTSVLTGILGATGLLPGTIDNFTKSFGLATISDQLQGKVIQAMGDYETANPPSKFTTRYDAVVAVRGYAEKCSAPFMASLVNSAVSAVTTGPTQPAVPAVSAVTTAIPAAGASPPAPPAPPPAPSASRRQIGGYGSTGFFIAR
jgi:hypothetical protein